jgi:hypothetical protein
MSELVLYTSDTGTYRPIAEIVEALHVIAAKARETDKSLRGILTRIGVGA